MGDAISLRREERRFIRLHLGTDVRAELNRVLDMLRKGLEERTQDT